MSAGRAIQEEIGANLRQADIILALLSPDYLASAAVKSLESGPDSGILSASRRIVPVILRACDWPTTTFGTLQALPEGGRPIQSRPNRDEAWLDVVRGIQRMLESSEGVRALLEHGTESDAGNRSL